MRVLLTSLGLLVAVAIIVWLVSLYLRPPAAASGAVPPSVAPIMQGGPARAVQNARDVLQGTGVDANRQMVDDLVNSELNRAQRGGADGRGAGQ